MSDKGVVHSKKEFVHSNDELADSEAVKAVRIIGEVQIKYWKKVANKQNLEALRDEALYRLATELGIKAELDPTPCFYGEPPILEIQGKMEGDDIHKYGFDHEKKGWEVKKAHERGEDYLGEKEALESKKQG